MYVLPHQLEDTFLVAIRDVLVLAHQVEDLVGHGVESSSHVVILSGLPFANAAHGKYRAKLVLENTLRHPDHRSGLELLAVNLGERGHR